MNRREFMTKGAAGMAGMVVAAEVAPQAPEIPLPKLEVGCPHGWLTGKPLGFTIGCDLSISGLSAGIGKFPGNDALWLRVRHEAVSLAKEIVYGMSVAQGLKAPIVQIAVDESLRSYPGIATGPDWTQADREQFTQCGWLISDGLPAGAMPIEWDYVFPEHVAVLDGKVVPMYTADHPQPEWEREYHRDRAQCTADEEESLGLVRRWDSNGRAEVLTGSGIVGYAVPEDPFPPAGFRSCQVNTLDAQNYFDEIADDATETLRSVIDRAEHIAEGVSHIANAIPIGGV